MDIEHCPICNSSKFTHFLNAKDYTVSNTIFQIVKCSDCGFKFTNPVPGLEEIGEYYKSNDYVSHSDTQSGIINYLYQLVKKFALRSKGKDILKWSNLKTGNLLDFGAGTGAFLFEMSGRGWQVVGIEPSEDARKLAKSNYNLLLLDPNEINKLNTNFFDVITLWHVLEHVHDLKPTILTLKKLLKKNGKIIIAVPNSDAKDAEIYKEFWAAYDVPRHLYHFSSDSMKTLLSEFGIKIIQRKLMPFDSFYVSMLSEKYKNGGTLGYFRAFINGLNSNLAANNDLCKSSSLIYVCENDTNYEH